MPTKEKPLNPAMDNIIRQVVKNRGYKIEKSETFPEAGSYLIRIENLAEITPGETFTPCAMSTDCIYIGVDVDDRSSDVTFSVVPDELSTRADALGICDILEFYTMIADAVPRFSFALHIDEEGLCFAEHRFTVHACNTAEAFDYGIETCLEAARDYVLGLENDVGLKY